MPLAHSCQKILSIKLVVWSKILIVRASSLFSHGAIVPKSSKKSIFQYYYSINVPTPKHRGCNQKGGACSIFDENDMNFSGCRAFFMLPTHISLTLIAAKSYIFHRFRRSNELRVSFQIHYYWRHRFPNLLCFVSL